MEFLPRDTVRHWKEKLAELRERWRGARQEIERLRRENERLQQEREQWEQERGRLERERGRLERERERARQEKEKLTKQLEEAQGAGKRKAAPFARGTSNLNPKPPGRKSGSAYGQHRRKASPQKVDEVIAVPAPTHCDCGGELEVERIASQFQQEIVRKTIWRRFDISICRCRKCNKRVQGRDPRQTSDALGAAAVQIGPEALALAVQMNKGLSMPHADVAALLQTGFGLQVNGSTISRALERAAGRGQAP